VGALLDRGLKETKRYDIGSNQQAIFFKKPYTVIVTSLDGMGADCTLWYAVGVGGLRLSG